MDDELEAWDAGGLVLAMIESIVDDAGQNNYAIIDTLGVDAIRPRVFHYVSRDRSSFGWGRPELGELNVTSYRISLVGLGDLYPNFQNGWKLIEVSEEQIDGGVPATRFDDDNPEESPAVYLRLSNAIISPELTEILLNFTQATDIEDASEGDLFDALERSGHADNPILAVYDVGQANLNAICDGGGVPVLYYDFGRPIGFNHHTSPKKWHEFCFTYEPPIVLSHWDKDHWLAARIPHKGWLARSLERNWIAPRQHIPPSHLALINAIYLHKGRVLFFTQPSIRVGNVELSICNGPNTMTDPRERNHCGIALHIFSQTNVVNAALAVGDADFQYVNMKNDVNYVGLVATHHGGKCSASTIPLSAVGGKLAFSFGAQNYYGHPSSRTSESYASRGWVNQLFTMNRSGQCNGEHIGNIALALTNVKPVPCTPRCINRCSLCLVQ